MDKEIRERRIRIPVPCFMLGLLLGLSILLSGCAKNTSAPTIDYASGVVPRILECGTPDDGASYHYFVDRNTGVVYLSYSASHRGGVTVMLNADGTVITAEQLGIDY